MPDAATIRDFDREPNEVCRDQEPTPFPCGDEQDRQQCQRYCNPQRPRGIAEPAPARQQAKASGTDQNAIGNQITKPLPTSGMTSPTHARSQGRSQTLTRMSGLPQAATAPILGEGRPEGKTAPPAFKGRLYRQR